MTLQALCEHSPPHFLLPLTGQADAVQASRSMADLEVTSSHPLGPGLADDSLWSTAHSRHVLLL